MTLPRVSVVIPARNAVRWLPDALRSVTDQSYPAERLEIVVVDDASEDEPERAAARTLTGTRVDWSVLSNATPAGPGGARNRGWRHSSGDWIQFLDADDVLAPDKIASQVHAAAGAHAGIALVYSAWGQLVEVADDWCKQPPVVMPSFDRDPLLDLLRPDNFMATGSQLFRREWLARVGGYDERRRVVEDVDLLLRISMAGGTFLAGGAPQPQFWYRRRQNSLSRGSARAFYEECVLNVEKVEAYVKEQSELTPARAKALAGHYCNAARFFAEHDQTMFSSLVRRIEHLDPDFLPERPAGLRVLARLMGYRRAEMAAVHYRQAKRLFRTTSA